MDCNDFWNEKIEQYKGQSQTLEQQLMTSHSEKMQQEEEALHQKFSGQGKLSPAVLNLEYQINCLVKEQRYLEANALERKMQKLVGAYQSNPPPASVLLG